MTLRSKLPKDVRERLMNDPFMTHCIVNAPACSGRTEWHHGFMYKGKRVNEDWAIIPLCHEHHERVYADEVDAEVRQAVRDRIRDMQMVMYFKHTYPKSDLFK